MTLPLIGPADHPPISATLRENINREVERTKQVADATLKNAMAKSVHEIRQNKYFENYTMNDKNVEFNFFYLMKTVHFLAKLTGWNPTVEGTGEHEKLMLECQNLSEIANQVDLQNFPWWLIDTADIPTAIDFASHLPDEQNELRTTIFNDILQQLNVNDNFDLIVEIAKACPPDLAGLFISNHVVDPLLQSKNYDQAEKLAQALPEPTRSKVFRVIAEMVAQINTFEEAKKYLNQLDPQFFDSNDFLRITPSSKEDILYLATKCNNPDKFLFRVGARLAKEKHFQQMAELLSAIKPGEKRDQWMERFVNKLHETNQPEIWELVELISDPAKKQKAVDTLGKKDKL